MLKRDGIEAALACRYPDRDSREAEIRKQAVDRARRWDANSLVILRRGTIGYDTVKDFAKMKTKVLYVLCRTDRLFAFDRSRGHGRSRRCRCRCALPRDRQQSRAFGERSGTRQNGRLFCANTWSR
jgi:hypothetical protein